MIAYAAVVWWPRVTYSTVAKRLEHIQRLACLYITGAIRTTPTAALELITGLVPLPVFIKQEAMASCYRLRVSSQWFQNGCGHTTIKCIMSHQIPECFSLVTGQLRSLELCSSYPQEGRLA